MFKELDTSTSIETTNKTISYKHSALGNRVAKLIDGDVTEKYLWLNKTTLLATYDQNDNLKQRFEYGLSHTPVKFTQNNNTYYITSDHLGSSRTVTDASGTVIKAIDYDSFGNVISDSNESFEIPFGFAGGLKDSDTGLLRFGYRDYDPKIGRWTARDPIGFAGGDTNLYGYVASDPVNWVDPDGLMATIGPARMVPNNMGGGARGKVTSCPASKGNTNSATGREALRKAKKENDVPTSAQPDKVIKPNTPEGNKAGLDNRNVKQYEYTNNKGEKVTIRQDKAATYGQGGIGDQPPHFNAGPKGGNLKQHHNY